MKPTFKTILLAALTLSVPAFAADAPRPTTTAQAMVVPTVSFANTTAKDVVAFLNTKSKELDPKKQGINIVLAATTDPTKTVSLNLNNASVLDILRASAGQLGLELQQSDTAILLTAKAK